MQTGQMGNTATSFLIDQIELQKRQQEMQKRQQDLQRQQQEVQKQQEEALKQQEIKREQELYDCYKGFKYCKKFDESN